MQAGANKIIGKNLLRGSKFSFNGIVTSLEKTVSTINQVVPLYNQIRPLISNSKTILNVFKNTRSSEPKKKSSRLNRYNMPQKVNTNIINVDPTINEEKKDSYNVFENIDIPNKPYFNN